MHKENPKKKIAVIGAGISGLSAAAYAAKQGYEVHVYEKHAMAGGRARQFKTDNGYIFDMGPSWYWMPDIIEGFFKDFGYSASNFYDLVALDPQFEMVFEEQTVAVPKDYSDLQRLFENLELGSAARLDAFMDSARYKYEVGMCEFVNKPCYSWLEFSSPKILGSVLKLNLLTNFRDYVRRYFSNPVLRTLMEFPVIFLGASPKKIPALYSLMNYGGYVLGTWYPMGGFYELVKAMQQVCEAQGVKFHFNSTAEKIKDDNGKISHIVVNGKAVYCDAVVASSDYQHSETLVEKELRNYQDHYWQTRTFAPSCLIYYLGFTQKLPNIKHHTLFFEHDLDSHIDAIYTEKKWPEKPLFYVCCPSKTDESVAPQGHENVFLLMPVAIELQDEDAVRERYLDEMLQRLEQKTGIENLKSFIDYKRSYCVSDFRKDYNAYGGNAYGLANTLSQTAVLKPGIKNKQIKNLYYTGQLTVPGPGVPPSVISGKIVAEQLKKL